MTWNISSGSPTDRIIDVQDEMGVKAKFKQPRDQGPRKLIEIANELIAYDLARTVGLYVAPTFLANVSGMVGVVSFVESTVSWSIISGNGLQSSVINLDTFRQLLVFDIWIANSDRAVGRQDHVIAKPIGDKFIAYPIDSGNTLNGPSGEVWTAEIVIDTSRHTVDNYSHVSEQEIQNYSQLEPMVIKIQAVSDEAINSIVESVTVHVSQNRPTEEVEILRKNSNVIKNLLSVRRNLLPVRVLAWCQAKGKGVSPQPQPGQLGVH